jgi:hypothetical protein
MAIYKFRVTYEDHDDVYREIEIKSSQTFEDFHNAIQKAIDFDNSHGASFYISDDYWRKGQEITLKESDLKGESPDKKPKKLMGKLRLANFIEDPHQKFVYVFDFSVHWTFWIELVKITLDEPKGDFPRCIKKSGAAPKQYKKVVLPPPGEEEDEDDIPKKEKIFTSEEGYDQPDEDEDDPLTEGEDEEGQLDEQEGENHEEI